MKLGYAQAEITPIKPSRLSGYGVERISVGVHDPLMVRVMVFKEKEIDAIFIQTDLIGIDSSIVNMLSSKINVASEKIMICCSHTHSGPTGTVKLAGLDSIFGEFDNEYVEYWVEKTVDSYNDACKSLSEVQVGYKQVDIANVGTDRHDGSYGDEKVGIWYFVTSDNHKYLLYNLACHPTVLNSDNLMITADLPYGVVSALKDQLEGVVFTNGSAGDISTRYTRNESSFKELKDKGELIADIILKAIDKMELKPLTTIKIKKKEFPIDLKEIPDRDKIKEAMDKQIELVEKAKEDGKSITEIRVLYSVVQGYDHNIRIINTLDQIHEICLSVTYLMINNTIMIGLPIELFSKLSHKYRIKDQRLHYVSYCNGYYMYLTNKKAFEENYYEAGTTIFAKGQGEILMERIYDFLLNLNW
ncbi:MAG: neutral/alkaline non-lysosomal ceramidase N-terminal domain-containing protein [Erysipelotrichaceae bacterium]|nr:neutral/alkaline non-lysosomal ceramidase N-terminal domain-containing protein [Erysipelotrichaceae bacterium]MDD4642412.1 neutral/alkaline non-lysosomal ceramidase N-terminal domain-containing protein [Erysipelotrichaceae bacterium]